MACVTGESKLSGLSPRAGKVGKRGGYRRDLLEEGTNMKGTDAQRSRSAAVRARLNHPIIDSDGHTAEFEPALFDYLRAVGGSQAVERFKAAPDIPFSSLCYLLSWAERRARRVPRAQ